MINDRYDLITYKWQHGVFPIEEMIRLVKNKTLSRQEFFTITRLDYDGVLRARDSVHTQLETHKKLCYN